MADEYGLAELAARSGVAPRTIRFYQSQGLLPKPRRHGRDARYDDGHEERLRLVAELQDRGLTLGAIRDLVGREGKETLSVADWLGKPATPDDVGKALDTLRPVARDTAGLIFAQEIERALLRLVEAGPAAVVKRRR